MPLLCRNLLALGLRNERQTDRERKKERKKLGEWWEKGGKKGKMGRQLSADRKNEREINKTKEGGRLGGSARGRRRRGRLYKVFRLHGLWE